MAGALPHIKQGPASYTAGGLVLGGQLVVPASGLSGSLAGLNGVGVMVAGTGANQLVLGVAASDANTGQYPEGTPSFPAGWPGDGSSTAQDELLDISILGYTVAVYNNVDINVTYDGSANASFGQYLTWSTSIGGCVRPIAVGSISDASLIVGRCTQPGGVLASGVGRAFIRV